EWRSSLSFRPSCLLLLSLQCSAHPPPLHSFPTRRSSDLHVALVESAEHAGQPATLDRRPVAEHRLADPVPGEQSGRDARVTSRRSEEHTSELQSRGHLVCRLLLEKKKKKTTITTIMNRHL